MKIQTFQIKYLLYTLLATSRKPKKILLTTIINSCEKIKDKNSEYKALI